MLAFAEHVHRFVALDRPLCCVECPKPQPRVHLAFHHLMHDRAFLAAHGIRVLMLGNPAFAVAVKAMYDGFKHLKDGGAVEDLSDQQASADLLRAVNRTDEFLHWQQRYLRS